MWWMEQTAQTKRASSHGGAAQTCVLLRRALVYPGFSFSGEEQEGGELMKTMGVRQM